MADTKTVDRVAMVKEEIEKLNSKSFNFYFFVMDSRNNPSGSLAYIYDTAYALKEMGYNVSMLYQMTKEDEEKDGFIGVSEWLGKKYEELPHHNIETENVDIAPSDFLIIPEVYAGMMGQIKKLPCKKIALVYNANHLPQFIPIGADLEMLKIYDAITISDVQANKLKSWFPLVKTNVVRPGIKPVFRDNGKPKQLVVNIVSKDESFTRKIIQPFFWKYPAYKWVTFREIRNLAQETVAEALSTAAITIWSDDYTPFGYTAIEAAKSGSIVLAKVPQETTDWMSDGEGLTDSILWFDDLTVAVNMLASVVHSWMLDKIPAEIYEGLKNFDNVYTQDEMKHDIEEVYINGYVETRKKEFKMLLNSLNKNNETKETK